MSRTQMALACATANPVRTIQTIIAVVVAILGIYVGFPWFVPTSESAIAAAFASNTLYHGTVGLFLVLPTLPIFAGYFSSKYNTIKWYTRSTLGIFIVLLFLTLLRIIFIGAFPLTWIFMLAAALVIGVCHLYWKSI